LGNRRADLIKGDRHDQRLYPWLIFFDTENGYRDWYDFLDDVGYKENWNPRGWYRRIKEPHFAKWGGADGYLRCLRDESGFRPS